MNSKHCLACGTEGHPKDRHPSSLRTEAIIWLLAIVVGSGAGLWSAITTPSPEPLSMRAQALALSAVQHVEPAPATAPADEPSRSVAGDLIGWLLGLVLAFVRSAWWVLPIPILFSLWRQLGTRPVCRSCGSPQLIEIATPHGALPPLR